MIHLLHCDPGSHLPHGGNTFFKPQIQGGAYVPLHGKTRGALDVSLSPMEDVANHRKPIGKWWFIGKYTIIYIIWLVVTGT